MERLAKIDERIKELEEQKQTVQGRQAEVYTRIVGYYRSVKNWNKGKREEYNHRVCFKDNEQSDENAYAKFNFAANYEAANVESCGCSTDYANSSPADNEAESYAYFYRKTCPNCPSVKKQLEKLSVAGEAIDVDTPEGVLIAKKYDVFSVPTVIFFDNAGEEIGRAKSAKEVKETEEKKAALVV